MADNPCQAIYMRALILALLLWFPNSAHAEPDEPALPRIVSLNLCADPYLMEFATPEQIIALTWNSHDPTQSPFAARAASYPVTGGRLEEVVEMAPDLVILSPFSIRNRVFGAQSRPKSLPGGLWNAASIFIDFLAFFLEIYFIDVMFNVMLDDSFSNSIVVCFDLWSGLFV